MPLPRPEPGLVPLPLPHTSRNSRAVTIASNARGLNVMRKP
jgi:hypothetical protein